LSAFTRRMGSSCPEPGHILQCDMQGGVNPRQSGAPNRLSGSKEVRLQNNCER
jgi:hypothetical protein